MSKGKLLGRKLRGTLVILREVADSAPPEDLTSLNSTSGTNSAVESKNAKIARLEEELDKTTENLLRANGTIEKLEGELQAEIYRAGVVNRNLAQSEKLVEHLKLSLKREEKLAKLNAEGTQYAVRTGLLATIAFVVALITLVVFILN